ncbi:magnesium transporter [Chytridium lagenaria]|nr:magnesium transporter [Chytridium lagenaria]
MEDKYVGLILAIISSVLIGTSFVVTKKGLMDSTKNSGGTAGEHYNYLNNMKWWAGMITMVLGEAANFTAYSYAPAILVTPLGAGSVFISAVLASMFLKEKLGKEGKIGCGLCVIGSIITILHSPEEKPINSVNEILHFAVQPAFVIYMLIVIGVSLHLIYNVGPVYGKQNMLVYISICSLVGSISVMACKGFGIALKLSFSRQQSIRKYIYVVGCAITQMNYFNKSVRSIFNKYFFSKIIFRRLTRAVYYVFFTSATILASIILFQGFHEATGAQVISVFCGFLTIFIGVFILSRQIYIRNERNRNIRCFTQTLK